MIPEEQILNAKILIIDDNILNVQILKKILLDAGYFNVVVTTDATKALELYKESRPDLVLLDFRMPHFNGIEVMGQFTSVDPDGYLPVLMITAEDDETLRARAFQAGAKDFLKKPYDRIEVLLRSRNIIEMRKLYNQIRLQNKSLEDNVKVRTQELLETRIDVVTRLARVAEYRDKNTGNHIIRVSQYAHVLARQLGLSEGQCELILNTMPLHDIGKVAVPDSILLKQGQLDAAEQDIMKKHTVWGSEMLSGSKSAFLKMAESIALTHHEKYDGTGYPNQLKAENIPLVGRIAAVADVFDALTSERPYKKAWGFDEAAQQIEKLSGTHFDPKVIQSFSIAKKDIRAIYETHH